MEGFARLKINWSILDLQDHISGKLAVKWLQVFIGSAGAVIARLHVVDKCTPKDHAIMWCECSGEHVGAVCVRTVVGAWTGLSLTVSFDDEATKIGNEAVDFV